MIKRKYLMIGFLALCLTATLFLTMATTSTASSSDSPYVPVGAIIPWAANLTGVPSLPDDFVECNGQTLNDAESPLNGQTIPDLNGFGGGTQKFLRGSTTSGATGGSETHSHTGTTGSVASWSGSNHFNLGSQGANHYHNFVTDESSTLPSYYEVVWIMRVKYTAPTESVGGFWIPVDKFSLLAPYIAIVSTIILVVSISVVHIKYRKKQ